MRALDRLGVDWQAWDRAEYGTLAVDIEGTRVHYAPDFLVDGRAIEVKGIFDALAATKVASWRRDRGELAMIMKDELLALEEARTADDAAETLQAACYLSPPTEAAYWD